jgi:hypothetical protein
MVIERGISALGAFDVTHWFNKCADKFVHSVKIPLARVGLREKNFANVMTPFHVVTSGQFSAAFAIIESAAGAAHDVDALSCPEFGLNSK